MKISYDQTADSILIVFQDVEVAESDEIREGVIIDYDFSGKVCGIEILDASSFISSKENLNKILVPEISII